MANQIVSVHAGIYGLGIYAIMLPSSGLSVAHYYMFGISRVSGHPDKHDKYHRRTHDPPTYVQSLWLTMYIKQRYPVNVHA